MNLQIVRWGIRTICALAGMLVAACSSSTGSNDTYTLYAFANRSNMTVDVDSSGVSSDQRVVFTLHGTPLVTGIGSIHLSQASSKPGGIMIVESPVRDTVVNPPASSTDDHVPQVILPFSFIANQEFSVVWKVRFTNIEPHMIGFVAYLDSIYLPDSLRSYPAQSYTVKDYIHVPRDAVYTTEAYSPVLQILP